MVAFPPCKINLGLNVLSKREDGFHDIETVFYSVPWTDILEIIPSDKTIFSSSGIAIPEDGSDNLCVKAYQLLKNDFRIDPVKIHLHKIIPVGAGLGGGSSDAAYTLRLLNSIFKLSLSPDQLRSCASRLGSDCPFFASEQPMLGTGRGEILQPLSISLKKYYLILVKPPIHVSTKEAYSGIRPQQPSNTLSEVIQLPLSEWKKFMKNDFEESVFIKYPAIENIKSELYRQGAIYASMSGSGSSVFGLFDSSISLQNKFSGMGYWAGML